jgi:hypothetical protein
MRYNELEQKYKDYFLEQFYENLGIDCEFIQIEFDLDFDIITKHKYSDDGEEFLYKYKQFNGVEIESYLVLLISNLTDVMFIYDSSKDSIYNRPLITTPIEIASTKLFEKYPELTN